MQIVDSDLGWPCLSCGLWIEGSAVRGELGHYHHACAPQCPWCAEELQEQGIEFMGSRVHFRCLEPAKAEIEREMHPEDPIHPWNEP